MDDQKVTVLFIAGAGRSGSTLLGNILGQVPGLFHGGEISRLFSRGVLEGWDCGCGAPFSSCPVWQDALRSAYPEGIDPARVVDIARGSQRVRSLPRLMTSPPASTTRRNAEYLRVLDHLYRAIASVTGCSAIVDSSKSPAYGYLLGLVPSIDLRVLHLVRDPRGTAYSWARRRTRTDSGRPRAMQTMGTAKSSALWSAWNLAAERFWKGDEHVPYRRLRYEDFIADPASQTVAALDLAGPAEAPQPLLRQLELGRPQLKPTHSISGNPGRMVTGEIELAADMEWTTNIASKDLLMVDLIGLHSLRRYGYRMGRRS